MNRHEAGFRIQGLRNLALLLVAALILATGLQSMAAAPADAGVALETIVVPEEALVWEAPVVKGQGAQAKLDGALMELASVAGEQEALRSLVRTRAMRMDGERVQVQLVTTARQRVQAAAALETAGGVVTGISRDQTLIQGWLAPQALELVAADDAVLFLQQPQEAVLLDDVAPDAPQAVAALTEGLAAMNGPAWHAAGHTGTGVKVGVIDGGFTGYNSLLGSDLPASVTVKNFVDGESDDEVDGSSAHGTACAEVVHDVAPGAQLFLAKVGTNLDLQEAVDWLKDTHQVDIISTSLGWYNLTPGDGTGAFADLVQEARDAGILWLTAAGNDREAHWGGPYYDPGNDDYHFYNATQNVNYFGPGDGQLYAIPAGVVIRVMVRWDDWTNVDQDYDLILARWNGSAWQSVAQSSAYQNGGAGQKPTESVAYVTSGATAGYGFVITRYDSDRAVNFEIFAPKVARLDELLHARSLANLADAPAAVTVAAVDVSSPYPQESYSSEGPANGPGGAETGGAMKPEIAAFANVSTISYGTTNKFNGTSSATPHVAGAAALVLSANPGYSPAQVESFLEGRAMDMGAAGVDTLFGYGRLHLGDPSDEPPPVDDFFNYLPMWVNNFPITPTPPSLQTIINDDGDGNYNIVWTAVAGATGYVLQEDDNATFSSPTQVFSGATTSTAISGRDVGTYHYRVRAQNAYAHSAWSNVRAVTVTVEPPACPQAGEWSGSTSQGRSISFEVTQSPTCQIVAQSLVISIRDSCGFSFTTTYMQAHSITNNSFATGSGSTTNWVQGSFGTPATASGTFNAWMINPYEPWRTCTATGTWSATP